jgi:hypothetical protein
VESLVNPVSGLNYTKRSLEIQLYFEMQNFMKIEQTEAYSGIRSYIKEKCIAPDTFLTN